MKVVVTNNQKQAISRLGQTFTQGKAVTLDVTPREYKALRAVRALTVEPEKPAPAEAKPAAKTGAKAGTKADGAAADGDNAAPKE